MQFLEMPTVGCVFHEDALGHGDLRNLTVSGSSNAGVEHAAEPNSKTNQRVNIKSVTSVL